MAAPWCPLVNKLSSYVDLTPFELSALSDLSAVRRRVTAGGDVVREGQSGRVAYVLISGWVCSYKLLGDGSRQIVDIQIPGDFLGLRGLFLRASDHSYEPITEIEVSEVPATRLFDALDRTPRLARAFMWAVSRDEAMVAEHLVDVGRRNALVRTTHFLLELSARLTLVNMGSPAGYACPLSQYQLADALGLTAIHLNRVLRRLREMGLLTFRKGRVTFENYNAAVEFAEFRSAYLDQDWVDWDVRQPLSA